MDLMVLIAGVKRDRYMS